MAILNVGVFLALPDYFSENSWTTKKEILWTIINVFLIGLGNYIFSFLIKVTGFSWWNWLVFEAYTMAVGVFPITISILANQVRLRNKFEGQSQKLNVDIEKKQSQLIAETGPSTIALESGTDGFTLAIENFLYAKSDDNYVEIYYVSNSTISRKIVRHTLTNVYALLSRHKNIFRCHKSYIVNLNHVHRVSGNAQGYKLHLRGTDELLPVSRAVNETIKLYFADHP